MRLVLILLNFGKQTGPMFSAWKIIDQYWWMTTEMLKKWLHTSCECRLPPVFVQWHGVGTRDAELLTSTIHWCTVAYLTFLLIAIAFIVTYFNHGSTNFRILVKIISRGSWYLLSRAARHYWLSTFKTGTDPYGLWCVTVLLA